MEESCVVANFVESNKEKHKKLFLDGYEFHWDKETEKKSIMFVKSKLHFDYYSFANCIQSHLSIKTTTIMCVFQINFSYRITKCTGRAIKLKNNLLNENIIRKGNHSHAPDARNKEASIVVQNIKKEAKTSNEKPRNIIAEAVSNVTVSVTPVVPNAICLTRTINRLRRKGSIVVNPQNLNELQLDETHTLTNKNEQFLLYDSGPGDKRTLIFATQDNIKLLQIAEEISADGTFSVTPPLFKQFYSIHGMSILIKMNVTLLFDMLYFFSIRSNKGKTFSSRIRFSF